MESPKLRQLVQKSAVKNAVSSGQRWFQHSFAQALNLKQWHVSDENGSQLLQRELHGVDQQGVVPLPG